MRSTHQVVGMTSLLGVGAIVALGLLAQGGTVASPKPTRMAPSDAPSQGRDTHDWLEGQGSAGRDREVGRWRAYLRVVEQALADGHVQVAVRVWPDAYGAALESRTWEGMLAVGDAVMGIGRATGSAGGARQAARDAYVVGLIRARRFRSVEGALRSAEAFAALDDRALVDQNLHIAATLAAGDERAQQRVRAARQRLAAPHVVAGS